jgi:glutaminyl-peptide cyclotransferase
MRSLRTLALLCSSLLFGATCGQEPPPRPNEDRDTVPAPFDGERAFEDLEAMAERGHRYYGAPERDEALAAMIARFEPHVATVERQSFTVDHPDGDGEITLVNVLLRQHPERPRRFIIGSHWDTRLWAEEDPDEARRDEPIMGANDGTSGIAVMVELARLLARHPLPELGVDFVLFDGEEYGRPGNDEYCQGSEHLADNLDEWYEDALPEGAIIMDMVADAELGIPRDTHSLRDARWLVQLVWSTARDLGEEAFIQGRTISIVDDHVPLNEAGIPSILLIDYDYPRPGAPTYWHTHSDTLEHTSAESLARVGNVVLTALRRLGR